LPPPRTGGRTGRSACRRGPCCLEGVLAAGPAHQIGRVGNSPGSMCRPMSCCSTNDFVWGAMRTREPAWRPASPARPAGAVATRRLLLSESREPLYNQSLDAV
jgi:hypothetical protein